LVDLAFLSSNMLKLLAGGWFPLVIGSAMFVLMMTWKQGRRLVSQAHASDAMPLKTFLDSVFLSPPTRVEGTAIFLSSETGIVPSALLHNLKHNKVLHEKNLFVCVNSLEIPWVGLSKRFEMQSLGHDCWQITLNFGFKNEPDVPKALSHINIQGCELDAMTTSYFLSRETVIPTIGSGMAPWREKLFAQMHRNASSVADFLNLPSNAVVELGSKVNI
jgi:KUP system potassium uptake protein